MRMLLLTCLALGPAPAADGDDGLSAEVLDRVKAATVLIKAGGHGHQRSGSGFVFHTDGEVGLIATCEHVVAPPAREDMPATEVVVVLRSGQPGERTADGAVVAVDRERDLAIIRVSGVGNLPKPLSVRDAAEPRETMSVYAAGFPLGAALSLTKGNPAVSVTRGSVSSLRTDEHGDLALVQINGPLHPGNSGGPVVDHGGRLVGVVAARVPGTDIAAAVPPRAVTGLLAGRLGPAGVRVRRVTNGSAEVEVSVPLIDPLDRIRTVAVRVARNDAFEELKPEKDGGWPPLKGGQEATLTVTDRVATGTVLLRSAAREVAYFSVQPVFARADKVPVYARPTEPFRIDYRADTAANLPTAPFRSKAIEVSPKAPTDWIFKEAKRGAPLFSDAGHVFSEVPDEIVGATLLVRRSAERTAWLEPYAISAQADGTVYVVFRWKCRGRAEVSEVALAKLEREGWAEVAGAVETTFPAGEDWRWRAYRRVVKKGEVVLQLRTVRWPDAPVLFAFQRGN